MLILPLDIYDMFMEDDGPNKFIVLGAAPKALAQQGHQRTATRNVAADSEQACRPHPQ
jgi:hypothetical protein